jgi:hypothetical protein
MSALNCVNSKLSLVASQFPGVLRRHRNLLESANKFVVAEIRVSVKNGRPDQNEVARLLMKLTIGTNYFEISQV